MSVEDHEVSDLLARGEEMLPESEETEQIRRDSPISLQAERMEDWETYRFEVCITSVDFVLENLHKEYPDENFDTDYFQRMPLCKYLSGNMSKLEFFIAQNQWPDEEIIFTPKNCPIRMKKGVISKWNRGKWTVYHLGCKDRSDATFHSSGFSHALLTVEAKNSKNFVNLVVETPSAFFCARCELFVFEDVMYYDDNQYKTPSTDIWPDCNYLAARSEIQNDFVELKTEKVFAEVQPQKKQKLAFSTLFDPADYSDYSDTDEEDLPIV